MIHNLSTDPTRPSEVRSPRDLRPLEARRVRGSKGEVDIAIVDPLRSLSRARVRVYSYGGEGTACPKTLHLSYRGCASVHHSLCITVEDSEYVELVHAQLIVLTYSSTVMLAEEQWCKHHSTDTQHAKLLVEK